MTRKVVLYIATSLDGYIADNEGQIDWLSSTTTLSEADDRYDVFYETIDTVILGRTTYDQVVHQLSPEVYPYGDCRSYVLTSRPGESQESVVFTDEEVVSLVKRLKKESGKDIWIVGGSQVVMPLAAANLIDSYQLSTIPVILGQGISLFKNLDQPLSLEFQDVTVKNGIVTTTYQRK